MSDTVDNPRDVLVEDAPRGFSCPGPFFLPGLMTALNIHLLALAASVYRTAQVGPTWATIGLIAGVIGGFWVIFLSGACVFGVRGAINMLGFVSAILFLIGVVVGIVGGLIWLGLWLAPAS